VSPIAVNRLLSYIETGGEGAIVRPWVWIAWIFIGPATNSITTEWYLYIFAVVLVRAEAIITQLVFEHALRIRMKAETDSESRSGSSTVVASRAHTPSPEREEGTSHESTASSGEERSSENTKATADKAARKGKADQPMEPPKAKNDNLIGLINNLVSTDLGNITDAQDFLYAGL
jgi:hypothetical protein